MSPRAPAPRPKLQLWWQLRVELLDVSPLIWRRLTVPDSITLPALHQVLQVTLGWTDSHLHEFVINGTRYAVPDPDWSDELQQRDERRVILSKALGQSRCGQPLLCNSQTAHAAMALTTRAEPACSRETSRPVTTSADSAGLRDVGTHCLTCSAS